MSITRQVSRFIEKTTLEQIPPDVVHLAKRSILDGIGLAIAGSRSRPAVAVRDYVGSERPSRHATVLGTSLRSTATGAALANGVAIHADDYDDTQLSASPDRVYGLLTHPTSTVLPAAAALSERDGRSGAELLTAYLVGVEVATKISEAISPRHYQDGFHSTATVGTFGSCAAACKLQGFDAEDSATAVGIAGSLAAGLRENFGTMTKPLHAGRAAESGVLSVELRSRGLTAAQNILEAQRGFFQAAGGGFSPSLIDGVLGQPWTFESPGISIKPHPCGSLTHPAMAALADLLDRHDIRADQVASLVVGTNRHMPTALIHHQPKNSFEAKFSMEYCMAILLLERTAGLREFADSSVQRKDAAEMIERITFQVDPDAEAAGYHTMRSNLRLELRDSTVLTASADFGKGSPANPMTDGELIQKFHECADWGGLKPSAAAGIVELIFALENEPSINRLVGLAAHGSTLPQVKSGERS